MLRKSYLQIRSMSFKEIYTTHYRKLVGFAFQYTQSVDDSEDVVQESFTRFWNEVQQGTEIQNAQAWLFKVMINLLKTKKSTERLRNGKENECDTKELQSDDFQAEYFLNERKKIISQELNLLPENEKSLLILYHRGLRK